jgi:ubiquinone/menaquinone biosynthesis C-methylase UbiE
VDEPWVIDELGHAGPEHLEPAFVAGYDRKQGFPDPSEDMAVFAAHGLSDVSTVIDLGAGTGQFALAAARRFGLVFAVDVSPVMLDVLGERARAGDVSNVRCVRAGFLTYEHAGPPANGVYSRNALHHLPDFLKALALTRVTQMLDRGGVVRIHDLIYDFRPDQANEVFDRWLSDAVQDPALGYTREDFAEHIRTEYSTFRWLFEPMLVAAGLEIVTVEFERRIYGAYTCIKR